MMKSLVSMSRRNRSLDMIEEYRGPTPARSLPPAARRPMSSEASMEAEGVKPGMIGSVIRRRVLLFVAARDGIYRQLSFDWWKGKRGGAFSTSQAGFDKLLHLFDAL